MFLQTLFSLAILWPATIAFTSFPPLNHPFSHNSIRVNSIRINGSHTFAAELFSPTPRSSASRYPGAILIATDATRDRAFLLANRMAEIGVTVLMYTQGVYADHQLLVLDAQAAVDSMRRRFDVRPEEIGVIAFEEATNIVPDVARDSTLNFAIAAASNDPSRAMMARYAKAQAATLVLQGVNTPMDTAAIARALGLAPRRSNSGDTTEVILSGPTSAAPNVTVWPVPKEQLEAIGDAHSLLGSRVVGWVCEQVHATPVTEQQPVTAH